MFREVIGVKGGAPVVEDVVVTRRGPIISPVLTADVPAVSLAATWLGEAALGTLDELHKAKNFDEFRQAWVNVESRVIRAGLRRRVGKYRWPHGRGVAVAPQGPRNAAHRRMGAGFGMGRRSGPFR